MAFNRFHRGTTQSARARGGSNPRLSPRTVTLLPLLGCLLLIAGLCAPWSKSYASQSEGQKPAEPIGEGESQPQKRTDPHLPRLTIGNQDGTPGTEVVVPLYFAPPQGVALRALSVEIEWVSKNLRFSRSERGIAAEAVGADVGAKVSRTVQDEKGLEHSTLLIEASLVEENPRRGIPEGLLAYLTFQISSEAQPAAIELRPKLISAEAIGTPARTFTQAEAESGKVTVELGDALAPYVNCFFFTH